MFSLEISISVPMSLYLHKNGYFDLSLMQDDPNLEVFRRELITSCGLKLDKARMIRFDESTTYMYPTDLGRVASHFYIKYDTIEVM